MLKGSQNYDNGDLKIKINRLHDRPYYKYFWFKRQWF